MEIYFSVRSSAGRWTVLSEQLVALLWLLGWFQAMGKAVFVRRGNTSVRCIGLLEEKQATCWQKGKKTRMC